MGSSVCQKWVGCIKKFSFFFHLNHQFLGIITQLTTYFDAFSQLYILHFQFSVFVEKRAHLTALETQGNKLVAQNFYFGPLKVLL